MAATSETSGSLAALAGCSCLGPAGTEICKVAAHLDPASQGDEHAQWCAHWNGVADAAAKVARQSAGGVARRHTMNIIFVNEAGRLTGAKDYICSFWPWLNMCLTSTIFLEASPN